MENEKILQDFSDLLDVIFNKVTLFNEIHQKKYPDEVKNIRQGINLTKTYQTVSGTVKTADLFIKNTYESWEKDGEKDRDLTVMSILKCVSNISGDTSDDKWEKIYKETNDEIIEDVWDTVKDLIPVCIQITYTLREPVTDENTGKTKFTKSFPSGQHKLSIKKLKSVWM